MDHVSPRLALAALVVVLLACTPLRSPGFFFEGVGWVRPGDVDYSQQVVVQVGATAHAVLHENDAGNVSRITNLSPHLVVMDEAPRGQFLFHALAIGEAEILFENECSSLGAPCDGIVPISIVAADAAVWGRDFSAVRGGRARGTVRLMHEGRYVVSPGGFTSRDGAVDHQTGTISFDVPVDGETHDVEAVTVGGTLFLLDVPLVDVSAIDTFDLSCSGDTCLVRAASASGRDLQGAPVRWTHEGVEVTAPPGGGTRLVIASDGYWGCEVCADLVGSPARACDYAPCGSPELLP